MIIASDSFDHKVGRLDVLGLGPGDPMWMAPVALDSLAASDVIIGYKTYIDLIRPILGLEKEVIATGMRQEVDRCRAAVDLALSGKRVAMVCSGDPGIYGLAGLVLQILQAHPEGTQVEVNIIPGISALNACSSKAVKILKEYRKFSTPVGIVRRAMRQGETVIITTLSDLANQDIDMQTTIIVGNSQTFVWQDRMITPRGYVIP
jgi:precorrin-3B C17-methyltransferase